MHRIIAIISLLSASLVVHSQAVDGWEPVFVDDFTFDDHGWITNSATNNVSRVSADMHRLVLELFDHGFARSTNYSTIDFNEDFILKAIVGSKGDAKFTKKARADFGLMIGYSSHRYREIQGSYTYFLNFYEKGILLKAQTPDGHIAFEIIVDVDYKPQANNEIGIKKEGTDVIFYLNDEEIHRGRSVKTAGGAITFIAYRKMKAFMRKISIYQKESRSGKELLEVSSKVTDAIKSASTGIRFTHGSAELTENARDHIRKLADYLKNEDVNVVIRSHTDDFGDPEDLIALSQRRAEVIAGELVTNGVTADRIKSEGLGDLFPITTNEHEEGRKINDRIEFKLIAKPNAN